MSEWINKMWHKHTVEYYLALKRNEIVIHATTRIHSEDRTPSEMSQTRKDKYYDFTYVRELE